MKSTEKTKSVPDCYTESSLSLLKSRFMRTDEKGNAIETPKDLFLRVANWVAQADKNYTKSKRTIEATVKNFQTILYNLRFIPNSPTIYNAGKKNKTLAGCFVLPIEDSLDDIYKTLSDAVQVQWHGGGTGFNFSHIRPKGDKAGGIPDVAAGPVHFIKTFSTALMGIRQGGKRGGGNMAILNIDHPDILEFIHMKEQDRTIMNFNISVGITDTFMKSLQNDEDYNLINPRTNKVEKTMRAADIFNEIVELAHRTGDPGIAFLDEIDRDNPTPNLGRIDATNPCGEQPLLPYESCNLGALNLRVHFDFDKKDIDWKMLRDTIHHAVHFLDNIIDINYYPVKKIEEITRRKNRKIGLGLMGFADVLIMKEIPYNSTKALKFAEKVMKFIQKEGIKASIEVAKTRGTFPNYKGSTWEKKKKPVRNATITTIAPNGNTSIIGGSSGGIEPAYSLVYKVGGLEDRNYRVTKVLFRITEGFKKLAQEKGFYSTRLVKKLGNGIPIQDINDIPSKYKEVLVTALDIEPIWHLRMQAAFQKYVDNAISKTINFPHEASLHDVKNVFIEAYKQHLKGVTIFRDGSKGAQTYVSTNKSKLNIESHITEKVDIVIASKNKRKIKDITSYFKMYNGTFNLVKQNFQLTEDDKFQGNISEDSLLANAKRKAKQVAEQTGKISIADESGFIFRGRGLPKDLTKVRYFGQDGDFSKEIFEKLKQYCSGLSGHKAYIASALAIYDPQNKHLLTTEIKIPGKLFQTKKRGYNIIFIHKGLTSFNQAPSQDKFMGFHHRYNAFQKIFDKFTTYRKEWLETKLSKNAYHVLERRALKKDKDGTIIETPTELFRRIACYVAQGDKKYNYSKEEVKESEENYFKILKNLEFQCGGALIWAGMSDSKGKKAIWSKCFVLPIEDSIKSIFDTLNDNIEVLRNGGGTGFNFSHIRSSYATVTTTGEKAAGPVEYLKVFNRSQDTIIGRGGRQMGSMAILNIDHPDIENFIAMKKDLGELTHYNISVGITDTYMNAVQKNKNWELIDPHDHKAYKTVKSRTLFEKIAKYAWLTGDPGVVFLDEMERGNPTPHVGIIESTNVCGEQPLIAYESCNLGNINLSKFVIDFPYHDDDEFIKLPLERKFDSIDWDHFKEVIFIAIEFLDNIIDINNYPIKAIEKMTKNTRNIGLGIMGFADLLIKLGIPYESDDAIKMGEHIMKFVNTNAHEASKALAKKRGNFPSFKGSIFDKQKKSFMRNSRCTTIAPTGTISIVANCNPGIEPIFALVYKRKNSLGGEDQTVIEPLFEQIARKREFYSEQMMDQLSSGKHISDIADIPEDVRNVFKTSHEIKPKQHVRIQSAFQKYCDSGVSKTINLPEEASVSDIKDIFQYAFKLKCKGITIFRNKSRISVQELGKGEEEKKKSDKIKIENKPRIRPETTHGITRQIKTDQGTLFITINEDDEGIAEVFLNIGKSGGYSSGYTEAIGRLISVSLRAGLKPEVIVDQLKGIRTSTPTLNKGMFVYSVPDAIGKVLEQHIKEREGRISMFTEEKIEVKKPEELDIKDEIKQESQNVQEATPPTTQEESNYDNHYSKNNEFDMLPECPDCGGDLEYAEGCILCRSCGYSKCG